MNERIDRITEQPDGSYRWSCSIDKEYHRKSVHKGILACAILVIFVLVLYFAVSSPDSEGNSLLIPGLVAFVILMIALPLFYLQYTAADPHEQYIMTKDYVRSGYGKAAVYSDYKKIKTIVITSNYIELIGYHESNRVYVPAEDLDFVMNYITSRIPSEAEICYSSEN